MYRAVNLMSYSDQEDDGQRCHSSNAQLFGGSFIFVSIVYRQAEFAVLATSVHSPVTYLQSVLYWLKHTAYRFKPTCPPNITLFNMAAHPSSLSCLIRYFIFTSVPWQAYVCAYMHTKSMFLFIT